MFVGERHHHRDRVRARPKVLFGYAQNAVEAARVHGEALFVDREAAHRLAGVGVADDAMKGVDFAKAIFDMRDGNPQFAALHMSLIYETHNQLAAMGKTPVFAVVFMAGAVKLISTDQSGFSAEDRKYLKEIADTVKKMADAGIHLEVCLFAVKVFGVEPALLLPEIKRVDNGWISEIGYQARGYSLVPVY